MTTGDVVDVYEADSNGQTDRRTGRQADGQANLCFFFSSFNPSLIIY